MLDGAFFKYAGEKFVSKQVDNRKKKKLKKVEEKMLGWGMLRSLLYSSRSFRKLTDSHFNLNFSPVSPFHLV